MNYFESNIIGVIESAGKAMVERNINSLSSALAILEDTVVQLDNKIEDLLYNMMLNENHPDVKRVQTQKEILTQFTKGFTIFYVFLSDGATDYIKWSNDYNNFFQTQPEDIFRSLIPTGELDQSSEEYQLYRELKTYINPVRSNNPDPQTTNTVTLYHVIDDITKVNQIKNTRKLIGSQFTNQLFFLGSLEDIKKYYNKYQIRVADTSVDPPIMKPLSRVNVATCVITQNIVTEYNNTIPDEPPAFVVNDIYIPWIVVIDVDELLIEPNKIFSRRIGRARVGTG